MRQSTQKLGTLRMEWMARVRSEAVYSEYHVLLHCPLTASDGQAADQGGAELHLGVWLWPHLRAPNFSAPW